MLKFETFQSELRGQLIRPGDPDYESARKVHNGMIDKCPAAIARCVDVADVIASVNFARDNELLLAIRSGGHNGPGLSTVDDGLVIDLSPMKGIRVDAVNRTARVETGCTLGEVHHATDAFGLGTPSGVVSTTGVGGITLGGGIGHLTRAYGLSIDNVLEFDVVLADGCYVQANADTNPDLFWALRGGGGNFGVVTSILFKLHPVDNLIAGPMLWHLDKARDVLRWYREYITKAPETINGFFTFMRVPPAAPFPEELHDKTMCGIVWAYTGSPEMANNVFGPIRAQFGPPALDWVGPISHSALNSMFDPLYPSGEQWYWKADFFNELSDAAIEAHLEHGTELPTFKSTTHLYPINGAAGRVPSDATPWAYRESNWCQVIVGVSPDPADATRITQWARDYWQALHPHSAGGGYVNFMMDEGSDRVRASYRGNYDRLAQIKAEYDPSNLFRVNQNIRPMVAVG
ncbi:MAG: FAD-binding oxidoreductase [Nitrolancea sp.]